MTTKHIPLEKIIRDLNSKLGDVPIMEKYDISPSQYADILERLHRARPLPETTVHARLNALKTAIPSDESRAAPRCYITLSLTIFDEMDLECRGLLVDLSEKGFQVADFECRIGEKRTFCLRMEWLEEEIIESKFVAECRWRNKKNTGGSLSAGFEITDISVKDYFRLQEIMNLTAICDG